MDPKYADALKSKMDAESFAKLEALNNEKLHAFVADAVALGQPESVKVCDDSPEDIAYVRDMAIRNREEHTLAMEGHTYHFDGPKDQGRDKAATKYLVPADMELDKTLNQTDRDAGLAEIRGLLDGAMQGRQALLRFFCLGPADSPFSISAVQLTDSAYVGHSEDMLYRPGYEQFRKLGESTEFFRVLHSSGKVDENMVSVEVDKRRIYIDIAEDLVLSVNTQYAGNTVGFKKLSLRMAIRRADREGWLAEHMLAMGVHGPNGRVTYFAGAFPSGCGKTSTAMLPGETIIGDDLAYFRVIDGQARMVNVESGIFGIIRDVNAEDDPVIYDVLTKPGEVIYSNVLIKDDKPYWEGMGSELPAEGTNFIGHWTKGMTDAEGNEIPPSHWNARYTVRLTALENLDPRWDDPQGVEIGGVIYGGRDSDTSVPVRQSFDWAHGIITMGASLESETTATTLGASGVRKFNLMSILDFLSIPLGKYVANNLTFAKGLANPPAVFSVNYFQKDEEGKYLTGMLDKAVWVKWMELRTHGDVEAIETPTGLIPLYADLKRLFSECLRKDYAEQDYVRQFTIRIPEELAKVDRIEEIYRKLPEVPAEVFEAFDAQRQRLTALREQKGDYVSPLDM